MNLAKPLLRRKLKLYFGSVTYQILTTNCVLLACPVRRESHHSGYYSEHEDRRCDSQWLPWNLCDIWCTSASWCLDIYSACIPYIPYLQLSRITSAMLQHNTSLVTINLFTVCCNHRTSVCLGQHGHTFTSTGLWTCDPGVSVIHYIMHDQHVSVQ